MQVTYVEKIDSNLMNDYQAVRNNIIVSAVRTGTPYGRVLVVSAYGGLTDPLEAHKKSGKPGMYALLANGHNSNGSFDALAKLKQQLFAINRRLFGSCELLYYANGFIEQRIQQAERCLEGLRKWCCHGHFNVAEHLNAVKEILTSISEAHSAFNTAQLLKRDGVNARFIDLTGWQCPNQLNLDQRIEQALADIDFSGELPIVTGYAHCHSGLMANFDSSYDEKIFSRVAVLTQAKEAIIHKEFRLNTADPRLIGEINAVPIDLINYDIANQLANLGMEAIQPKAAKDLRQANIPLRVKNTFEPTHSGTLVTTEYVSDSPGVEMIFGNKGIFALQLLDQNMIGNIESYDKEILALFKDFKLHIVSKHINANTITHYLDASVKTIEQLCRALEQRFANAKVAQQKVAIVSVLGSNLQIPDILPKAMAALSEQRINILNTYDSMRFIDIQFVIDEAKYDQAIRSLHRSLIEVQEQGSAICLAS